jgi:hypothetical protein
VITLARSAPTYLSKAEFICRQKGVRIRVRQKEVIGLKRNALGTNTIPLFTTFWYSRGKVLPLLVRLKKKFCQWDGSLFVN